MKTQLVACINTFAYKLDENHDGYDIFIHISIASNLLTCCSWFSSSWSCPYRLRSRPKRSFLVNSLTPEYHMDEHLTSFISYDYYFNLLDFCKPREPPTMQRESLGSILFGDRIFNSPFELYMLKNESCKQLCTREYEVQNSVFTAEAIRGDYHFNW